MLLIRRLCPCQACLSWLEKCYDRRLLSSILAIVLQFFLGFFRKATVRGYGFIVKDYLSELEVISVFIDSIYDLYSPSTFFQKAMLFGEKGVSLGEVPNVPLTVQHTDLASEIGRFSFYLCI